MFVLQINLALKGLNQNRANVSWLLETNLGPMQHGVQGNVRLRWLINHKPEGVKDDWGECPPQRTTYEEPMLF